MRARPVYQHLDRRTKVGWFTLPEWGRLLGCAAVAYVWWKALSPFGFSGTACGVVIVFSPAIAAAYLREVYELGLGHRLRGHVRLLVGPRRYQPGSGRRVRGYALAADTRARTKPRRGRRRGAAGGGEEAAGGA